MRYCPGCGSREVQRARQRELLDIPLLLLLLRPFRCHSCMRRFYRCLLAPCWY
jgi:hypothetical protein